ncbi:serine/threonine-protein kinase [Paludisphaera rhizosphaerae]|uniref:serine/threonine-protein kinase n=1 Tax=Paludisphaera rhizosphaerae TaxID=2711216 RepID=UPI0013EC9393|nr:serine/threonine-protein kinase [Paludisphaera rhizosphaerae]
MSERSPEETHGPSPSEVQRMAEACARFEEAWRRGDRPDLEESLADAGPQADQLLERLLSLELTFRADAGEEPKPEEYISRFPASRGLVEAAFAELSTAGGASRKAPLRGVNSRNLLVGILALQNGFIDHASLIAAIQAWAVDKSRRLGEILLRAGKLDARQLELLEALAEEHRRRFGDDVHKSLAAFGSLAPVIRAVEGMGDPDVEASLTTPPTTGDTDATTAHDAPDAEAGENPAGGGGARGRSWSSSRFRILRFHDAGMLGRIFIALDQELNRNVALKEIQEKHAYHPVSRDQFVLEGMVTGALEHPGIVPVYSLGTHEDGTPFYAMRFIQGPSLREKLKQLHGATDAAPPPPGEPPVTLPRLLRHFVSACQAMAYAHSRGVLHRDLKPDHILLGPFGETLVVDWGLAMPIPRKEGESAVVGDSIHLPPGGYDSTLAQDGVVVGTVAYMSPEQAGGFISRMDQTSDVYALGAILYAILTGKAPFTGGDFATMLGRVRRGDFARPREINRDVPTALEAVCLKAMGHNPGDRYPTAADLAQDVERWLDDEPTMAFLEPLPIRAGRWLRRHQTTAAAAAVALISTLVGLAALNVQTARANAAIRSERDLAAVARDQAVAARREVEENYAKSLDLTERFLERIAAEDLLLIPAAIPLREDTAGMAAGFLDSISKWKPADPEVRFQTARNYRELANIRRIQGKLDEQSYDRAVALLREAAVIRPDVPRYRDFLAETLLDLGGAHRIRNDPDRAAPFLAEAAKLSEALRLEYPKEPRYQRTEARVSNSLANNHLGVGSFKEAAEAAEHAVGLMKPLADSENPGRTDRLEVVLFQDTLGEALLELREFARAAAELGEVVRRADDEVQKNPTDKLKTVFRQQRSNARTKLARSLAGAGGQAEQAKKAVDGAVGELSELSRISPKNTNYRRALIEALLARAELQAAAGALPEARSDLTRADEEAQELIKADAKNSAFSALKGRALGKLALLDVRQSNVKAARPRLEEALVHLRSARDVNPRNARTQRSLEEFEVALSGLPAAGD